MITERHGKPTIEDKAGAHSHKQVENHSVKLRFYSEDWTRNDCETLVSRKKIVILNVFREESSTANTRR